MLLLRVRGVLDRAVIARGARQLFPISDRSKRIFVAGMLWRAHVPQHLPEHRQEQGEYRLLR